MNPARARRMDAVVWNATGELEQFMDASYPWGYSQGFRDWIIEETLSRACRMDAVVQNATGELEQFMDASFFGFKYYDCDFPRCLLWADATPRGLTTDARRSWIWFMRFVEGFYLKPVRAPARARARHSGRRQRRNVL